MSAKPPTRRARLDRLRRVHVAVAILAGLSTTAAALALPLVVGSAAGGFIVLLQVFSLDTLRAIAAEDEGRF